MHTPRDILTARLLALPDVETREAWGETAFFVNPGGRLPSGSYFATIKEADGPNDRASALDRPGVWRLSLGIGAAEFDALFGARAARPAKGGVIAGPWDFTARDTLMPHPVYGWMGWVAILDPSAATLDGMRGLVASAHARATKRAMRRRAGA